MPHATSKTDTSTFREHVGPRTKLAPSLEQSGEGVGVSGDSYVDRLAALSAHARRRASELPNDTKDRYAQALRQELLAQAVAYDNAIEIYRSWTTNTTPETRGG